MATLWCAECTLDAGPLAWRCPRCGQPLELRNETTATLQVDDRRSGLWRFASWLPVTATLSLGEPVTPLLHLEWSGVDVRLKLEGAQPTGSFKDRGAAVLVSWLSQHGAREAVIDSSGNAGAALAAYCAAAGLRCHVYAPASASAGKLVQVRAYGADLHQVLGTRHEVTEAAIVASDAAAGAVYASHAWSPLFLAGTETFAYELAEQLGDAPDAIVLPTGAGTLTLGAALGFARLRSAGVVSRLPRIYGIQSAGCAPLAEADRTGSDEPVDVVVGDTAAEGIRIARPPRGRQVLREVRASGGRVLAVDDDGLWRAHRALSRRGVYPEPTSAVAVAGLDELMARGWVRAGETVVVAVTGTGLKAGAAGPSAP